ncbi:MAG: hypothetical protein KDK70_03780 [Myxococcales bacterium]|nr:hypothetical protein [Myxococcales bacterium]
MPRLSDAIQAMQYVKERIPLDRSDNKFIPQHRSTLPFAERLQSRQAAVGWLNTVRSHPRCPHQGQSSPSDVVKYGAYVLAAAHGNCLEMSCAAAWYLNEVGCFGWDMVYYPNGDHVYLVMGQPTDLQGRFPDDFADWDPEAVICDVWADIACPAREYPARWRARMHNWQTMGLVLGNLLPTHPNWHDLIDGDKSSFLH